MGCAGQEVFQVERDEMIALLAGASEPIQEIAGGSTAADPKSEVGREARDIGEPETPSLSPVSMEASYNHISLA